MRWSVAEHAELCGADYGCQIAAGEPLARFGPKLRVIRCAAHAAAMGYPVDWQEVESERWRLERERAVHAAETAAQRDAYEAEQAKRLAAHLAKPVPKPASKPPLPARRVLPGLFDPKVAALSDGDR